MRRQSLIVALIAVFVSAAATAPADVISVNLAQYNLATHVMAPTQTYGVTNQGCHVSGWNNLVGTLSATGLPFADGTPSSVNLSGINSGGFNVGNSAYTNTPLYSGLTDYTTTVNPDSVTLNNLNANFPYGYKVIAYVQAYLSNRGGSISDGTTTYYFLAYTNAAQIPNPVPLIEITNTTPGTYQLGQYAVFGAASLLTSDSLTLTIRSLSGGGVIFGGFQIVGLTPADVLQRKWVGNVNENWDDSALNWTNDVFGTTNYAEGCMVHFTDAAVAGSPNLNLTSSWQPASVTVNSTKNYTFTGGGIAGAGGFTQRGSGTTTLSNANTYSGNTIINGGTLRIGNPGAIPNGASAGSLSVASGAILDLNGVNTGINGLSGSGTITNSGAAANLTVGLNNDATTFSGVIRGAIGMLKQGSNTMTLTGTSSHSGVTTVAQGTLALRPVSTFSSFSALVVGNGATLGVTVFTNLGLVTTANVSLNGGVALSFDLGNAYQNGSVIPISTTGNLNLSGINQIALTGYNFRVGTYTLMNFNSRTGSGSISATPASLPPGVAATIQVNSSSIVLNVTSASNQHPVGELLPFPIGANQRATVTCLETPAFTYDIYLPPAYSTNGPPLPILYTMSPAGGGQVTPFLATCSNLNVILVGITQTSNGMPSWLDAFRPFYAVTLDIRHRVRYDPTAEFAGGFSGGGECAYMLSRVRAQHVSGLLEMAGSMGRGNIGASVQYYSIDRVQTNMLIARTTGTTDSAALFYSPFHSNFLATCSAVIKDWTFSGGHVVPADSIKSACLSWLISSRTPADPTQRTNALALAADWQARIDNDELESVFRECVSNLVHIPRTWYAHAAELTLDQILTDDAAFRALDVSNLGVGNSAVDYFFYYANGAAANGDWRRYNSCMKALTGITPTNDINGTVTNSGIMVTVTIPTTNGIVYITGSDRDRDGHIYSLLINSNDTRYLPTVLQISPTGSGKMKINLAKDTPGLTYSLESLSELASGNWQNTAGSNFETSTSWSAEVDIAPAPTNALFRVYAVPLPATSPPWPL